MTKLSQLTTNDKIKLAAEIDGKKELKQIGVNLYEVPKNFYPAIKVPDYATSYDAIIPLVQKQTITIQEDVLLALVSMFDKTISEHGIRFTDFTDWRQQTLIQFSTTPSQLLDALLVATGKAEL